MKPETPDTQAPAWKSAIDAQNPSFEGSSRRENSHRMKGRPTAVGGTAGIEQEYPFPANTERMMAVAINNSVDSFAVKFFQHPLFQAGRWPPAMDQADTKSADLDDPSEGYAGGSSIHVPLNGVNLALTKGEKNRRIDHVSGMKNNFTFVKVLGRQPLQKGERLLNSGKVRIRKDSDLYHNVLFRRQPVDLVPTEGPLDSIL